MKAGQLDFNFFSFLCFWDYFLFQMATSAISVQNTLHEDKDHADFALSSISSVQQNAQLVFVCQ